MRRLGASLLQLSLDDGDEDEVKRALQAIQLSEKEELLMEREMRVLVLEKTVKS